MAGDETFAAGLMEAAEFIQFARLVLDAGGDVIRLFLHQRVDSGLGVRRETRRGGQTLQLVGKFLNAHLAFRHAGLRCRKRLLRLGALRSHFALAGGLRGGKFVKVLERLGLLGLNRGALRHHGGHPLLGGPRSLCGVLRLATRSAHARFSLLESLFEAFDLLPKRRVFLVTASVVFPIGLRRRSGRRRLERRAYLNETRTGREASA